MNVTDVEDGRVFIAYRDGGNSNQGTAIIGTVSGTSISFGSETVFNDGQPITKQYMLLMVKWLMFIEMVETLFTNSNCCYCFIKHSIY